jgi:hypothetical protein
MPAEPPLAAALDALPAVREPTLTEAYRWALARAPADDEVTRALARLVARSERGARP